MSDININIEDIQDIVLNITDSQDIDIGISDSQPISLDINDSQSINIDIIESQPINYDFSITHYDADSFLQLLDVPKSYSGQEDKILIVNSDEDSLIFVDAAEVCVPYRGALKDVDIGNHTLTCNEYIINDEENFKINMLDSTIHYITEEDEDYTSRLKFYNGFEINRDTHYGTYDMSFNGSWSYPTGKIEEGVLFGSTCAGRVTTDILETNKGYGREFVTQFWAKVGVSGTIFQYNDSETKTTVSITYNTSTSVLTLSRILNGVRTDSNTATISGLNSSLHHYHLYLKNGDPDGEDPEDLNTQLTLIIDGVDDGTTIDILSTDFGTSTTSDVILYSGGTTATLNVATTGYSRLLLDEVGIWTGEPESTYNNGNGMGYESIFSIKIDVKNKILFSKQGGLGWSTSDYFSPYSLDIGDGAFAVTHSGRVWLSYYTTNGFVKTKYDDGTVYIDPTEYLDVTVAESDYFNMTTKTSDDITEGSINLFDKTVTLTEGQNVTITGIYPDFTIAFENVDTLYTVKYDENDISAGYLKDKTSAGTGISLAEDTDKLQITNSDTGSSAVSSHNSAYDHTKIATALQYSLSSITYYGGL